VELSESELRDMINLTSINSFIEDEKANKSINIFDNQSILNIILEDFVNLNDPIFQENDSILNEISNENSNNINENSITGNMNFNPENLVDAILGNELDY
ncbi:24692_t:CDS:1, partial [Dentiscutata erythropus]